MKLIKMFFKLNFANTHCNWTINKWETVLFSDIFKFSIIISEEMCTARLNKCKRLDPQDCEISFKHGGGLGSRGVGHLTKINAIMDRFLYKDILKTEMIPYVEWNMPLLGFFNTITTRNTSKLVKYYLRT